MLAARCNCLCGAGRAIQKIRKTAKRNLIVSVDTYEADVMDKYYEEQFMKKDQSLRIPEKANMQEYSERLEAIVKRWGVKKPFFLQRGGLSNNILVMFGFALVKHDRQTPLKYGFIKPTGAASM